MSLSNFFLLFYFNNTFFSGLKLFLGAPKDLSMLWLDLWEVCKYTGEEDRLVVRQKG